MHNSHDEVLLNLKTSNSNAVKLNHFVRAVIICILYCTHNVLSEPNTERFFAVSEVSYAFDSNTVLD